jgi:hypothetical protein
LAKDIKARQSSQAALWKLIGSDASGTLPQLPAKSHFRVNCSGRPVLDWRPASARQNPSYLIDELTQSLLLLSNSAERSY